MFGTLTNYLTLDVPLSTDAEVARNQVFGALVGGRSYFVNRLDGAAPAILFRARQQQCQWHMGDTASLNDGPLTFEAEVGPDAYLRLIHNNAPVASGWHVLRHSVDSPGVYRLEGYRGGRPWLFTNPLWVV
jgi:hypothetical protein